MSVKVGFIGTGNMGGALLRGIARGNTGNKYELFAYDINRDALDQLARDTGLKPCGSNVELVIASDLVFLAVKPRYAKAVLEEIRDALGSKILVSIVVGLPISWYKGILGEQARVVRTMPNTPALVGEGMTLVCFDGTQSSQEKQSIMELFGYSGKAEELEEGLMSEVTALTGSSPAYVFMFIEAMADAAVQSGIPRDKAYRLAAQAVLGSAKMLLETGKHPGELKDMVCSPAGTTIEAVAELEKAGFRSAIIRAMGGCTRKAREIGKQ